ncbi:hypothetical protein A1D15_1336 [Lactiplantibacillus plantarum]|nr:hypothetical protein A1D15_1336 [Lactiplantibacillus plantarum]
MINLWQTNLKNFQVPTTITKWLETFSKKMHLTKKLNWERKVKTSFSIQQKNIDRLDEMVNQLNAKSRSTLLDTIIENAYRDFQE